MAASDPAVSVPEPPTIGAWRGLIWGFDVVAGVARPIERPLTGLPVARADDGSLRWLHINLADQWARRWLDAAPLPMGVRDLLLSTDRHQRALCEDGVVAMIVHDVEREFDTAMTGRVGALTVLLLPGLIVTARQHPVCAADIVHQRISRGARPATAGAALDLLFGAIAEVASDAAMRMTATIQAAEDALIDAGRAPDARALLGVRKRLILLHRQISGIRGVLTRLEGDEDLPAHLETSIERLSQRMMSLDGDIVAAQGNLRLLREELDVQQANRTGQNLYLLSILSALLLPATLVTGLFGMNTGGLPGVGTPHGTWLAAALAAGSSAAVYLWLRAQGFFRH